jgi:hypothetical protein
MRWRVMRDPNHLYAGMLRVGSDCNEIQRAFITLNSICGWFICAVVQLPVDSRCLENDTERLLMIALAALASSF